MLDIEFIALQLNILQRREIMLKKYIKLMKEQQSYNIETIVIVQLTKLMFNKEINIYILQLEKCNDKYFYRVGTWHHHTIDVRLSSIFCHAIIGASLKAITTPLFGFNRYQYTDIHCELDRANLTENDRSSNQSRGIAGKKSVTGKSALYFT